MAHSLKADTTYNLSTSEEDDSNLQLYFVKLTDSSLKAIEDYIEYQAAIKGKPKIQFVAQNGVLNIPSRPGSASQDIGKKFKFSCSTFARNDRHGILDCIHQPNSKEKRLGSYGTLDRKIAVMATDEAYELTRSRMAQADQERKEVRTKEININHSKSKKKKFTLAPVGKDLNKLVKKKLPNPPFSKSTVGLKPTSQNSNSSSNSKNFSYKDRIIHILAVRPMKKPEILARLQKDGISQKYKNSLGVVLQQVATMQDNAFKLNKRFYADLKPDTWPYYTESEKSTVKKFVAQNSTQESSPKVTSTSKSPEDKGIKRPLNNDSPNNVQAKKPRIAKPLQDPSTSSSYSSTLLSKKIESNEKTKHTTPTPVYTEYSPGKKPISKIEESPPAVASTTETPEHLLKYQPIKSYQQRCRYKQDFQAEYGEYRELKENVDSISRKFIELDRTRKRHPQDSAEAKKIQEEIYRLYDKHQKDAKFHAMKRRCKELHERLTHIKNLVVEYDRHYILQSA
eukprot:gene9716-10704_t